MRDSIERTMETVVDLATAWESFATPDGMCRWFSERIEGDWSEGGEAVLMWGVHRCRIRIVEIDEPWAFAYQWVPGVASDELIEGRMTTVRFTLSQRPDGGTLIHMVESGFASLPAEFYAEAFGNNDEGWTEELAKLEAMLA